MEDSNLTYDNFRMVIDHLREAMKFADLHYQSAKMYGDEDDQFTAWDTYQHIRDLFEITIRAL